MNIDLLVPLFAAAVVSGTPLLYATLGELCTEKTGVLNLGVEGVMLVGCLAAFVTARLTGSPWLAFAFLHAPKNKHCCFFFKKELVFLNFYIGFTTL